MTINKLKRKNYFDKSVVLLLIFTFSCTSDDKNPTVFDDVQPFSISDACDNPIGLNFYIAEASLIPIPREDLTFENLGLPGAEAIADELMSEDGFCSLAISSSSENLFKQVEQLILDGNNSEARNLLATILGNGKINLVLKNNLNRASSFITDDRQNVRDWLRAAAYDQKAGGDGQAYINNAQDAYSTWAEGYIPGATAEEALRIAAEAQLLGLDELGDSALDQAVKQVQNDLVSAVNSFDPCTATVNDVDDLLKKLAKEQMLTGEAGAEYNNVMESAAQAMIKNGVNPEASRQVFGDWIEDPICDGFKFEWTIIVSDGWTFVGEGSSCDGINWEGSVALSGTNSTGASVNSSGIISFIIQDGSNVTQTTVSTSGTFTLDDNTLSFTDPLPMNFVFLESEMQAEITIASDGSGLLTTPAGLITFASVWTTSPTFSVVLVRNSNCDEQ
jgi:hypothetical protein